MQLFSSLGKAATNVGRKILNNSGRALELASKEPKLIAATAPDIIKFVFQGKGVYLGKLHYIKISWVISVFSSRS